MSYFIYQKNNNDSEGNLYRIAENEFDLNNLNIMLLEYKIIQNTQENFNAVKFGTKFPVEYNNTITFLDQTLSFKNKEGLQNQVNNLKKQIKEFTNNNLNHPLYNRWNSYYDQLNNLNLDSITYPFNKSLEQYFNDLGQPSYNILQLP